MGFNTSTNMNLPIPQVGNEAGPQYATDVNNCLTLVDQHNHSPGYGTQINPNGLNINADLPMNTNNLTTARTVRFTSQPTVLAAAADVGCLYEVVNDLYFNDGLGNNVRITQSGGVAGTPGSISNLVPPASVAYVALTKTFVFQSDTMTAANLDVGNVILRTLSVSSPGLTLQAPSSISSDYVISLPLLPASNLPVSIDASGNMSAALITTAQIDPAFILQATRTQVAYLRDVKGSGVSGGNSGGAGTWHQRDINTLDNPGGYPWVSVPVANQFTLTAGTYKIDGGAPFTQGTDASMVKLVNVSDATDVMYGTTCNDGVGCSVISTLRGVFTIAATKTFEFQYRITNGGVSDGLGVPTIFGVNNTYADFEIQSIVL